MTSSDLFLGLDVGTSAIKAVLLDAGGAVAGAASVATPWVEGRDGRVEAAVDDLLEAVRGAIGALGERGRVVAVGVAGMAESGAGFGRDGRAVTPVIAWNDPRGDEAVARLQEAFGGDYDRWIGQRARRVLSVAKLAWLADHGAPVVRWLGVPELVLHRLTGSEVTEHSLAARTGCYDVGALRWRPEVAAAVGLPSGLFPDICRAGQGMGRITKEGAVWSGLREAIPVTIGGHDHLAGAIGVGATARDLINSVGTAETVLGRFAALPDLDVALSHRLAVTVAPGGTGWAALAGAARAGIIVRRAASAIGRSPEELDRLATDAIDVAAWVAALADDPAAPAPDGEPGAVWAGVLHALSQRTADAARRVMALPSAFDRMIVIGGGVRSRPWLRAKAALAPAPVWHASDVEAAARGAALFAGVAAGWWPDVAAAPAAPLTPVTGQGNDSSDQN